MAVRPFPKARDVENKRHADQESDNQFRIAAGGPVAQKEASGRHQEAGWEQSVGALSKHTPSSARQASAE
jgi:hypothetical protein